MDLAGAYLRLGAFDRGGHDTGRSAPGLVQNLRDLQSRAEAAGIALPQRVPGAAGDAAHARDLLIDEVIEIGTRLRHNGLADEYILARQIAVEVMLEAPGPDPLRCAEALGVLGAALTARGRHGEALQAAQRAACLLAPLADGVRERPTGRYALAVRDCGTNLAALGRPAEALHAKREALRVYDLCLRQWPHFAPDVAFTCREIFDLLRRTGAAQDALEISVRAIGLLRQVLTGHSGPAARRPARELVVALRDHAGLLTSLGRIDESEPFLAEAVALLQTMPDPGPHPAQDRALSALTLVMLSDARSALGRADEALAAAQEAVRLTDTPAIRAQTHPAYARRLVERGRLLDARDALIAALPEAPPHSHPTLAPALHELSTLLARHGHLRDGAQAVASALPLYEALADQDPCWAPALVDALGWTAELQSRCGWNEAALRTAERCVQVARAQPSATHLARAVGQLGSALSRVGDYEAAEQATRQALELWQDLADRDPERYRRNLAGAWHNLANRLGDLEREEESAAASQRAIDLHEPGHPDRANALNSLAVRLHRLGRPAAARDAARQAVDLYTALVEDDPRLLPQLAQALSNLACYHSALGERDEAAGACHRATLILGDLLAADRHSFEPSLLAALDRTAQYMVAAGRLEGAVWAATRRAEVLQARDGAAPGVELAETLANLGGFLTGLERYDEARKTLEQAESLCLDVPALRAFTLDKLAWCHHMLDDPQEAARVARQGVALLEPAETDETAPHLPLLGVLLTDLSRYLRQCRRPLEALEAAGRAVAVRERLAARRPGYVPALAASLREKGHALIALDRPDQAQPLFDRAADLDPRA